MDSENTSIVVRRAGPGDCDAIWHAFEDEAAYGPTLQLPFPSRELWLKRLGEQADGDFILVAEVNGQVAGNAGLHSAGHSKRRAHAMVLGMTVHRHSQGKGVGNALMHALLDLADNWLPVTRIELSVFTDNERAIALYRKFGFEIEGTHRAYALRAGRYVDTHSMARLRPKPAAA